jgi:uncharacterized protein YndB with AHSA1/START domain
MKRSLTKEMPMKPEFRVQTRIRKPVAAVFDAFVDPAKLCAFFTATASGPLTEGATVTWTWRDYDLKAPVHVVAVRANELVALEWTASKTGAKTRIEIRFRPLDAQSTLVQIAESGWAADDAGLRASYDNCEGWTHVLHCLKAHLEHGLDLRDAHLPG